MDGNSELGRGAGDESPDVVLGAEPQLGAVGDTGRKGLGDQPAGAAIASGDGRGVVEQRPGVEDLEDLWVGMAKGRAVRFG